MNVLSHVQTNSSKAGLSKAELARCFYISVIPISVWRAQLCPAPRYLSGHSNRNNTDIKHRASSAQPCFTAVCLEMA